MSLDEIFADVKKEGSDPFAAYDRETETPTESQPEKELKEEKPDLGDTPKEDTEKPTGNIDPSKEEDTPFHIRWQKREEKLKADFEEKLEAYKREIGETIEEKINPSDSNIPDWFTELYGDNQVAWEKYEQREIAREKEIEQRVLKAYETKQQEQVDQSKKWEKWVDDQVAILETEGKKFDRNELIKTVIDYRPTDEQGNFDLRKGYDIMVAIKGKQDETKNQASIARKTIADTTSKKTNGDSPKKDYMTPSDLRNKTWNQI